WSLVNVVPLTTALPAVAASKNWINPGLETVKAPEPLKACEALRTTRRRAGLVYGLRTRTSASFVVMGGCGGGRWRSPRWGGAGGLREGGAAVGVWLVDIGDRLDGQWLGHLHAPPRPQQQLAVRQRWLRGHAFKISCRKGGASAGAHVTECDLEQHIAFLQRLPDGLARPCHYLELIADPVRELAARTVKVLPVRGGRSRSKQRNGVVGFHSRLPSRPARWLQLRGPAARPRQGGTVR